jgi:hypothetical protein
MILRWLGAFPGGRDPSREPQIGGDRGDWIEVKPRRRKARREAEEGYHRHRDYSRYWYGRTRSPSSRQNRPRLRVNNRHQELPFDHSVGVSPRGQYFSALFINNNRHFFIMFVTFKIMKSLE